MEQNKCNKCGRPMQYATEPKCNYCDACMSEYCGCKLGRIKEIEPTCDSTAVIPSITVESVEGITNLANCLVHVNDINTTFYVDDKHRVMITWAGPVDIPGYDMKNNPNGYRDQIVTDVENETAVIYDKHGNGYLFGITPENLQTAIDNKLDEMATDGTLEDIIATYMDDVTHTFDTVADMKQATNLIAGSYAQTFGFHSLDDGGGALYYITDTGTANETSVIAVGSLYANLAIKDSIINAKQFGAYGDDTHNDADALNALFEYAYLNKLDVYIPQGTYLTNSTLTIYCPSSTTVSGLKINGAGRGLTIIKANDDITNLINISPYGENTMNANVFIGNFTLDGNNEATNGINIDGAGFTNSRIENLLITKCGGAGITNETSHANTYLSSFIKIRIAQCNTGIEISNGTNTSLRVSDCYTVNCVNGYAIAGRYSSFINNCADHVTGTVFKFVAFSGTILNPGSESPNAQYIFDFTRSNATVIDAWTYGNLSSNSAVHINLHANCIINFEGGKIMLNPETSSTDGVAEGKLYKLAINCKLNFNGTIYSSYKTENDYNEFVNASTDNNGSGLISKRYGGLISYIGRDTSDTDGKASAESINGTLVSNAIYFGLSESLRYGIDGTDFRWKKHTTQGDILLTRKPDEIGGIGWIQSADMTAEGASIYWGGGKYLKIPVVHSGDTNNRPTDGLVAGQMFFDTTLGKPIWYSGAEWVDSTGTTV